MEQACVVCLQLNWQRQCWPDQEGEGEGRRKFSTTFQLPSPSRCIRPLGPSLVFGGIKVGPNGSDNIRVQSAGTFQEQLRVPLFQNPKLFALDRSPAEPDDVWNSTYPCNSLSIYLVVNKTVAERTHHGDARESCTPVWSILDTREMFHQPRLWLSVYGKILICLTSKNHDFWIAVSEGEFFFSHSKESVVVPAQFLQSFRARFRQRRHGPTPHVVHGFPDHLLRSSYPRYLDACTIDVWKRDTLYMISHVICAIRLL